MIDMYNIVEAYSGMYPRLIVEEFHPQIQEIMDNDSIPVANKLNMVTAKARNLIKAGVDTGMESDKPKKGSSRAVFFPKAPKRVTVDGHDVNTPTAVKIAFSGQLDKHHGESSLLGEDQNEKESDHHINRSYGILKYDRGDHYESSNHESGGVLAPVFGTHPEHHHLEMGRVTPAVSKDIAEATRTKEFPKGLKHEDIQEAMMHEHNMAHGMGHGSLKNGAYDQEMHDRLDKIKEHPWVEHAISMMHDSGMHPGDLSKRNMGIYHHPVTGKKHLAIIDYGFSSEIAKKYTKARTNSYRKNRGY